MLTKFQSTRPVWGATRINIYVTVNILFQSTRPVWGATVRLYIISGTVRIFQSTRPVWGATPAALPPAAPARHFNPRAPCGARR